ncbi:MAG: hypothetical protein WD577_02555 [Bacteroidales bacterium]
METIKAKNHVNLVAVLHIVFGALTIAGAIILLFLIQIGSHYIPEDEALAKEIVGSIGYLLAGIIAFFGLFDLLAGASLYSYRQWSRIIVIIISAINCLNIPIGTAKGVYSIWALMQPEVQELFE